MERRYGAASCAQTLGFHHYLEASSDKKTAVRGRWQSTRTARLHIDEGMAALAPIVSTPAQERHIRSLAASVATAQIPYCRYRVKQLRRSGVSGHHHFGRVFGNVTTTVVWFARLAHGLRRPALALAVLAHVQHVSRCVLRLPVRRSITCFLLRCQHVWRLQNASVLLRRSSPSATLFLSWSVGGTGTPDNCYRFHLELCVQD